MPDCRIKRLHIVAMLPLRARYLTPQSLIIFDDVLCRLALSLLTCVLPNSDIRQLRVPSFKPNPVRAVERTMTHAVSKADEASVAANRSIFARHCRYQHPARHLDVNCRSNQQSNCEALNSISTVHRSTCNIVACCLPSHNSRKHHSRKHLPQDAQWNTQDSEPSATSTFLIELQ